MEWVINILTGLVKGRLSGTYNNSLGGVRVYSGAPTVVLGGLHWVVSYNLPPVCNFAFPNRALGEKKEGGAGKRGVFFSAVTQRGLSASGGTLP